MAGLVDRHALAARLADPTPLTPEAFKLLDGLAHATDEVEGQDGVSARRELIVRALARRGELEPFGAVLDALVRKVGLFPYLRAELLGAADRLAYEAHRPIDMPDAGVVLHAAQGDAYRRLLDGEDLVLAAPTSFGKSLLIDALIASGEYEQVVVIVPTLALIDEARRRLARWRAEGYVLVSHPSQAPGPRTIVLMTQERILEHASLPNPDLLVVDEFYKLDPGMDPERAALLNQAFVRLRRRARQLYMLGPSVDGLAPGVPRALREAFRSTDYTTVALDVERIDVPNDEREGRLIELAHGLSGPSLVYCSSPQRCARIAGLLGAAGLGAAHEQTGAAADWLAEHLHPQWTVAQALRAGVGIHHAQMPRWLGQWMVHAFNEGWVFWLVCTSTLIEGVNTSAANVVIFDNKAGSGKLLDHFTWANIRGRSGRMRRHFVGRVVHFDPEPSRERTVIDIPVLTQPEDAPEGMLLELEPQERSDISNRRLHALLDDAPLPEELLARHPGVPVRRQLALARLLAEEPDFYSEDLAWSGLPNRIQLEACCELMWQQLRTANGQQAGVVSGSSLRSALDLLRALPVPRELFAHLQQATDPPAPTRMVERHMAFLRRWADYEVPKMLRCLDDIQRHVLGVADEPTGDYRAFAAQVEARFQAPGLVTLEEHGVPVELARRLEALQGHDGLDGLLEALRTLDVAAFEGLSAFERGLLERAQGAL